MCLSGFGMCPRERYARTVDVVMPTNVATSSVVHQSLGKLVMVLTVQQSSCRKTPEMIDDSAIS
jgi:hypothetical protein